MEEDQKTQGVIQEEVRLDVPQAAPSGSNVNFSTLPQRANNKGKGKAKTLIGLFILVIFVVGGFLIFKDANKSQVTEEETATPEAVVEEQATPTPAAVTVDRATVSVDIQNGTGISGEAAFLRDALKDLGYSTFTLGNAPTSDNTTTTVTYKSTLEQAVQDEITAKLNELYKEVNVKNSTTQTKDVVVITGLQKNATAKPAATSTPKASTSPSASPSASPTAQ